MAGDVGWRRGANAKRQLQSSSLVPPGSVAWHAQRTGAEVQPVLRHRAEVTRCTGSCTLAQRIHSRCQRLLGDLPMAGSTVRLRHSARRFRCDGVGCGRRIFIERFDPEVPWARRANRWTNSSSRMRSLI